MEHAMSTAVFSHFGIHVTNLDLRFFSGLSGRIGRQCPLQDGQSVSAAPPCNKCRREIPKYIACSLWRTNRL